MKRIFPPSPSWSKRLSRIYSPVVLALLLAFSIPARADTQDAWLEAVAYYDAGQYKSAVGALENLLQSGSLADPARIKEALELLGAAYFYLDDREAAREPFTRLLIQNPDHELDPVRYPPPMRAFYARIREEKKAELDSLIEERKRQDEIKRKMLEAERARQAERRKVYIDRVYRENLYALNFFPFGVGQFQNQQPAKGWIFLSIQTAGLAANISGYAVAEALRNKRGFYNTAPPPGANPASFTPDHDKAKLARGFQWGGLVVFLAGYAAGVTDSLLNYQSTIKLQERNLGGGDQTAPSPARPGPAAPAPPASPASKPDPSSPAGESPSSGIQWKLTPGVGDIFGASLELKF
ncbi:MAG: hypothetical protein GMKNLPBB_00073 [Myxococcota bacterium]|nr:hypothetical protein [Myxococcota bacterium]